jgi:hypothetical protein
MMLLKADPEVPSLDSRISPRQGKKQADEDKRLQYTRVLRENSIQAFSTQWNITFDRLASATSLSSS